MLGTIHHSVPLHLTTQPLLAILQPESMWHTAIESLQQPSTRPITMIQLIRQYSTTTFELGVLMSCNYARLGCAYIDTTGPANHRLPSERIYIHARTSLKTGHVTCTLALTNMLHFSILATVSTALTAT